MYLKDKDKNIKLLTIVKTINNNIVIIFIVGLQIIFIMEGKNLEDRIKQHNEDYYKKSISSCVSDWELFMEIFCGNRLIAGKIEKHIKSMKNSQYIENI